MVVVLLWVVLVVLVGVVEVVMVVMVTLVEAVLVGVVLVGMLIGVLVGVVPDGGAGGDPQLLPVIQTYNREVMKDEQCLLLIGSYKT